jgi:hypothetical protein
MSDTKTDTLAISYDDLQQQADDLQNKLNNLSATNGGSVWVGVKNLDALIASTAGLIGQIQASIINVQGGCYTPFSNQNDAVAAIQDGLDEVRKSITAGDTYATNQSPDAIAADVVGNLQKEVDATVKKLPGSTQITVWLVLIAVILLLLLVRKVA